MNPIHIPKPYFPRSILMLSPHLRLGLPNGLLPSGLPTKMFYAPLTSAMRATCPAHLILLVLITLTILGEEYKPCSSSLCSFLQLPVKTVHWKQEMELLDRTHRPQYTTQVNTPPFDTAWWKKWQRHQIWPRILEPSIPEFWKVCKITT
jgi:hypothetical protein